MGGTIEITPTVARRMALVRQRLAGPRPPVTRAGLMELLRDLRCLQLDPIRAVERSHLLVLWSRLGAFSLADLDHLLWESRELFEYWAHCASIVLTEDYPLHRHWMGREQVSDAAWTQRVTAWIEANHVLRDHILDKLQVEGPKLARAFEDCAVEPWQSSGWTGGRNVDRMLSFLWARGRVMVAGRRGLQKLWHLTEAWMPEHTPGERLDAQEVVKRSVQLSLRGLGVATAQDINNHFIRGCYPGLAGVLDELESAGQLARVTVVAEQGAWPQAWYVHWEDLPLLERLAAGEWEPRTTLLSPFDNLICNRERTELLWNFRYRIEIYVPQKKRQYGYYVLPILHGDRLIGRVDSRMDRKDKLYYVNNIYFESDVWPDSETLAALHTTLAELSTFLGARFVVYGGDISPLWQP